MKHGQLEFFLLLIILPLFGIFPQGLTPRYQTRQFNSMYKTLSNTLLKNNRIADYINYYVFQQASIKNHFPLAYIDSIIYITQPPFVNVKILCTYDNKGRIISEIELPWTYGHWEQNRRLTYNYNSIGKLASILFEFFTPVLNPQSRITFAYDSIGNKLSELEEIMINSNWVNEYYSSFEYDSDGNEEKNISMTWADTGWVNSYQYINYCTGGFRDSMYIEKWIDGKWLPNILFKFGYDYQCNLISSLIYSSNGFQWVNTERVGFNYDVNRNMTSGLTEEWDGSQWINYCRFSYEYNDRNYFTHGQNEIWQDGIWVAGDDSFYFTTTDEFRHGFIGTELNVYYNITSVQEKKLDLNNYSLSQNYPNPFNPVTSIKYTIPVDGLVQIKIYDILGKEITTLVYENKHEGNYEVKFNAGNLPSGIYIYRINSGSFSKSGKMILQK